MPKDLEIKDVADVLSEADLQNPHLPFLSFDPDHIHLLMFQLAGPVIAEPDRVGPKDEGRTTLEMIRFLTLAKDRGVDLAVCPEYSCTWEALVQAVLSDIVPPVGKLWALACESARPTDLERAIERLGTKAIVIFDSSVLHEAGNFINPLCYLFRTKTHTGKDALVLLIQSKTEQMGGKDHFEYSYLKVGHLLYRFKNSDAEGSALIGLLCSDSLHPQLKNNYAKLQKQTLVLHLQLNVHPDSEPFRAYRNACYNWAPRSTEILCLNWAAGTKIESGGKTVVIEDPRTILFRGTDQLADDDGRIGENHVKGCYLTYSPRFRTAGFVFAPHPRLFHFEMTKPWTEGVATNISRTGPRMIEVLRWDAGASNWCAEAPLCDGFKRSWMDPYPEVAAILQSVCERPVDVERLIQLSLGYARSNGWWDWKELPSFELESDESCRRLTVALTNSGKGREFRDQCLSRFRAFSSLVSRADTLSKRLKAFSPGAFSVTYSRAVRRRSFHNLHLPDGTSATVIYLGEYPAEDLKREIKKRSQQILFDIGADRQLLAIWYSEGSEIRDFMDEDDPKFDDDPDIGPTYFDNTSL